MLPLMRQELGETARAIDEAAVKFWCDQPGAAARAEEIYHRLWLAEDESQIELRWDQDAGRLLEDALDEFEALAASNILGPGPEARIWLYLHLKRELPAQLRGFSGQRDWESDAEARARSLLADGHADQALQILRERSTRIPASPLWPLELDALQLVGRDSEGLSVAR